MTPLSAFGGSANLLAALALVSGEAAQGVFVVPEPTGIALNYSRNLDRLWLLGRAVALAFPFLLLFSGWGARLSHKIGRITGGRRHLTVALFAASYVVLFSVVSLPLSALQSLVNAPRHGMAALSLAEWAGGQASGLGLALAAALLLAWIPYVLFERSPRRWPLWSGVILVPLATGWLLTQPMRTELRQVSAPDLQAKISAMAARADSPEVRLAMMTAGRKGRCGAAHVLGLGPTSVIVLEEELLQHHPEREVLFTVAHELKHYARGDDRQGLYVAVALIVGGLAAVFFGAPAAIGRWSERFGFDALSDPASLPLIVLILTMFHLAVLPVFNLYGRHIEQEADRYALQLTRDNTGAATRMKRVLNCGRRPGNPEATWVARTFRQHHPSPGDRIRFAGDYRPWLTGEKQAYARSFRAPAQGHGASPHAAGSARRNGDADQVRD